MDTTTRAQPTTIPYTLILVTGLLLFFVVYPVCYYLRDKKGLRRFPGMTTLAGITNLPFMIEAHRGFRSMTLVKLHRKHPVIRTGPNSLSFSETKAIKDIYGHNTPCSKDGQYIVTAGSHYHLADVVDRGEHARKRKVLSSAYALRNLEDWEYKVADKCKRMIEQFDRRCTMPPKPTQPISEKELTVDYRMWSNFFTLDAIADIGLSERLGFLDNGHDRCVARSENGRTWEVNYRDCLYQNARKQALLVWSYDWYAWLDRISNVIPFYRRMTEFATGWNGIVLERATKRLQRYETGEKLDDFFQALMEDKNGSPNNLEWGEIVAEVSIMMNAGSATTAIAMANALLLLLQHPDCMAKVRAEVDAALDDDDVVAPYDKVKYLPYMRACLDEALRLWPPTPHGLPRSTPPEGLAVADHYIPGGVTVSMPAIVAHRNEEIFPDADKFNPDRWSGEQGRNLQPYFLAFSAGARGCIGRNISYLEQTVVLASILHRYEFALPCAGWDITRLETLNLLLGPMPVKIWRRQERNGEISEKN